MSSIREELISALNDRTTLTRDAVIELLTRAVAEIDRLSRENKKLASQPETLQNAAICRVERSVSKNPPNRE